MKEFCKFVSSPTNKFIGVVALALMLAGGLCLFESLRTRRYILTVHGLSVSVIQEEWQPLRHTDRAAAFRTVDGEIMLFIYWAEAGKFGAREMAEKQAAQTELEGMRLVRLPKKVADAPLETWELATTNRGTGEELQPDGTYATVPFVGLDLIRNVVLNGYVVRIEIALPFYKQESDARDEALLKDLRSRIDRVRYWK